VYKGLVFWFKLLNKNGFKETVKQLYIRPKLQYSNLQKKNDITREVAVVPESPFKGWINQPPSIGRMVIHAYPIILSYPSLSTPYKT